MTETAAAEEWRYLRAALVVLGVLVVGQVAWLVLRSDPPAPTAIELTTRCLRREKLLTVESPADDPIAQRASGGSLATRVEGNGVHVAFAASAAEAADLAAAYLETGRWIESRLEVRGRVVYVWEKPGEASPTQRQGMYDCWYE